MKSAQEELQYRYDYALQVYASPAAFFMAIGDYVDIVTQSSILMRHITGLMYKEPKVLNILFPLESWKITDKTSWFALLIVQRYLFAPYPPKLSSSQLKKLTDEELAKIPENDISYATFYESMKMVLSQDSEQDIKQDIFVPETYKVHLIRAHKELIESLESGVSIGSVKYNPPTTWKFSDDVITKNGQPVTREGGLPLFPSKTSMRRKVFGALWENHGAELSYVQIFEAMGVVPPKPKSRDGAHRAVREAARDLSKSLKPHGGEVFIVDKTVKLVLSP